PYGHGYAYFGERMDNGTPIEENWINRAGSEDFRNLVNYVDDYRPLAGRYAVGEHSNFLMAPMQLVALQQVNAWGPARIQSYCAGLWKGVEPMLRELGVHIPTERVHHLVGLRLPASIDPDKLAAEFGKRKLMVSYRGDAVRVSPNVYNTEEEMIRMAMAVGVSRR
ncbi:MAG: aminotransferase, partial [Lewinella sp.]